MSGLCCSRCGSGVGSLEARVDHLAGGVVLQVVRCLACGWRAEREVPRAVSRRREVMPPDQDGSGAKESFNKRSLACDVPGCAGRYDPTKAHYPLCSFHRLPLAAWERRRQRGKGNGPAPLSLVNGRWVPCGEPLPDIPGEKPAVAVSKSSPRRVKRKGSVIGTCTRCRARRVEIVAWELCRACHEGYRRGEFNI
jgi:hypothetical protein